MEISSLELSRGFSNPGEADEGCSYKERECESRVLRMGKLPRLDCWGGKGQSKLREARPRLPDEAAMQPAARAPLFLRWMACGGWPAVDGLRWMA